MFGDASVAEGMLTREHGGLLESVQTQWTFEGARHFLELCVDCDQLFFCDNCWFVVVCEGGDCVVAHGVAAIQLRRGKDLFCVCSSFELHDGRAHALIRRRE